MNGVADEAHALLRVEAAYGLHQADIAFLNQVAMRQAVAQVLARDGNDQPQVRHDEPASGFEVVVANEFARVLQLLLRREHGHAVNRTDISLQIAQWWQSNG